MYEKLKNIIPVSWHFKKTLLKGNFALYHKSANEQCRAPLPFCRSESAPFRLLAKGLHVFCFSFKQLVLSSQASLSTQFSFKSQQIHKGHHFRFSLPSSQCLNQQHLRHSQTVGNDNHTFFILVSNTGAPQGCVLGPTILFTLSTHNSLSTTTPLLAGFWTKIRAHTGKKNQQWYTANNLLLNIKKKIQEVYC